MYKIFNLYFVLVFLFILTGCGKNNDSSKSDIQAKSILEIKSESIEKVGKYVEKCYSSTRLQANLRTENKMADAENMVVFAIATENIAVYLGKEKGKNKEKTLEYLEDLYAKYKPAHLDSNAPIENSKNEIAEEGRVSQECSDAINSDSELKNILTVYAANVIKTAKNRTAEESGSTAPAPAPVVQVAAPTLTPVAVVDDSPFAPSFDCAKASNGQEKLVCADRDLSKLDVEQSQAYSKAKEKSADKDNLKKLQLEWIKFSLRACSDKNCLISSYKKRIAELQ